MVFGKRNNLSRNPFGYSNSPPPRAPRGYTPPPSRALRLAQKKTQKRDRIVAARMKNEADNIKARKETAERQRYKSLYGREMQKTRDYYQRGGERQNVSSTYLRNLDKLKYMSQGTRRPLDMIDVFGRQ